MTDKTLIVGFGSHHGDDAIGWRVIERLVERHLSNCTLRRARVPLDLLDWLGDIDRLILCDAVIDPQGCGEVTKHAWPAATFARCPSSGSHDLGLTKVLELASTLNRLPAHVTLWTIAVKDPEMPLPTSVQAAAVETAAMAIENALSVSPSVD